MNTKLMIGWIGLHKRILISAIVFATLAVCAVFAIRDLFKPVGIQFMCVEFDSPQKALPGCVITEVNLGTSCVADTHGFCQIKGLPFGEDLLFKATMDGYITAAYYAAPIVVREPLPLYEFCLQPIPIPAPTQ